MGFSVRLNVRVSDWIGYVRVSVRVRVGVRD